LKKDFTDKTVKKKQCQSHNIKIEYSRDWLWFNKIKILKWKSSFLNKSWFGKIKSLISILDNDPEFEVFVFCYRHAFASGIWTYADWNWTTCDFKNVHTFENSTHETTMDLTLAKTIEGLSIIAKGKSWSNCSSWRSSRNFGRRYCGFTQQYSVAHIEGGELGNSRRVNSA
jgi:hypothetical protein